MSLASELAAILSEDRVVTSGEEVGRHGGGVADHSPRPPEAVVYPESREEVAAVLVFAGEYGVSVTPFGQGSSLEGHVVPERGGISLDTSRMDRIVELRPEDLIARVEPGVTHERLNRELAPHGLFFPVDPGWDASIGGMAATNASGTNAVRHGVMRDQVLGLEVALANGSLMTTGGLSAKSSAGYDLTSLFVGSEGTLGVFTGITLRLKPLPEMAIAARATFGSVEEAGEAAIVMIRSGMLVGRVELVDERTVAAVNAYSGTAYPESPTLFLEFSGDEAAVEADTGRAREIARSGGCDSFEHEQDPAARETLWEARHKAGLAVRALNPGKATISTDVCVPISDLPGALGAARRTISEAGFEGAILGHVGDGNYHAIFPMDASDPGDVDRASRVNAEIVDYALARGGTCTGEHGIGSGKRRSLEKEHGDSIPLMRGIKRLLDPDGILNPGKVLPNET
ncbi:FAD-binding oxidoreductase [Rubrobacter aplysinae]|uniref:FAD-binding oxidoreductase n=1 Tax=Rubrobacter aplysinae TaxID=909625 RepID=UPI00064B864B|nr:FAD-linked oxidase C-terminal domain-containing protein [Rubrobacter aplysinae]